MLFFIHIVNSKTAPVFHKTFDWGTGEFENENGEKWSSPYGIGIIYNTSDEKSEWEDIPVPAGTQAVKYDMSDEIFVEMLSRILGLFRRWYDSGYEWKNLESG